MMEEDGIFSSARDMEVTTSNEENHEENQEEVRLSVELGSLATMGPTTTTSATAELRKSEKSRRLTKFGNMTINDHFTLSNPSSTVTFRQDQAIILVNDLTQVVLEKKGHNDYVTVSQTTLSTPGLLLIRMVGTLVAFLMTGFLFVFCVQFILFLFLGLTIESGKYKNIEYFYLYPKMIKAFSSHQSFCAAKTSNLS